MHLSHSITASSTKDWVLECKLNARDDALAIALSSSVIKFYDTSSLRQVGTTVTLAPSGKPSGSQRICATKWDVNSPFLYYVACGSSDSWDIGIGQSLAPRREAKVCSIDTRSGSVVSAWDFGALAREAGELGAMEVSTSGTILCLGLGSEVLFFDVRGGRQAQGVGGGGSNSSNSNSSSSAPPPPLLDRYSSHSDAVTSIVWHPTLARHTLSASEDGLINVYDSGIAGEEDALVSTLSVGGSVSHFGVFGPSGALVHCATRTGELSLWNIGGAEKLAEFGGLRGAGAGGSSVDSSGAGAGAVGGGLELDFLLSAHYHPSQDTLTAVAAGNSGVIHLLDVALGRCGVRRVLRGGHDAPPRCAAMPQGDPGVLFSGGEDGRVCAWRDSPVGVGGRVRGREEETGGCDVGTSETSWSDEAAAFGKTKVPRKR